MAGGRRLAIGSRNDPVRRLEVVEAPSGEVKGGEETVLVVEDDDEVREVAVSMLTELGYRVVGFIDDRAVGDHIGHRGLPLLGTLNTWQPSRMLGGEDAPRALPSPA